MDTIIACNLVKWEKLTQAKKNGGLGIRGARETWTLHLWQTRLEDDEGRKCSLGKCTCEQIYERSKRPEQNKKQEWWIKCLERNCSRGFTQVDEEACNDMICWKDEPSCTISVTLAYSIIHGVAGSGEDNTWSEIWKLHVPNKMRLFIWLAYHLRIMSNEMRKRKGFTSAWKTHIIS